MSRRPGADPPGAAHAIAVQQPLKRYASLGLIFSIVCGGVLIFSGHGPLGRGLILGTLFSIINFCLIAAALPLRIGRGRGPSTMISLASISLRYALLAAPLVIAVRYPQYAIASTAAGLFMVQLAILLDQVWTARRKLAAAEE